MQDERYPQSTLDRFWAKVDQSGECWEWTASTTRGYGGSYVDEARRNVRAHRFAYELLVGPIPEDLVTDHLCRNRGCVNPAHLEIVTNRVNVLRGVSVPARNASATHCVRGHEFTPENTYYYPPPRRTGRECRTCRRLAGRATYWKLAAAGSGEGERSEQ